MLLQRLQYREFTSSRRAFRNRTPPRDYSNPYDTVIASYNYIFYSLGHDSLGGSRNVPSIGTSFAETGTRVLRNRLAVRRVRDPLPGRAACRPDLPHRLRPRIGLDGIPAVAVDAGGDIVADGRDLPQIDDGVDRRHRLVWTVDDDVARPSATDPGDGP